MKLFPNVCLSQRSIRVQCDSKSYICSSMNLNINVKRKYIDIQYHFMCYMVEDGKLVLEKVGTLNNVVDALKKSMSTEKFKWFYESIVLTVSLINQSIV